jgi:hypothetical protein
MTQSSRRRSRSITPTDIRRTRSQSPKRTPTTSVSPSPRRRGRSHSPRRRTPRESKSPKKK